MKTDLRDLEVFYWVARLGNFHRAAERLNTTQPAISQRISNLETNLSVQLIQRGARISTLTPKGRQLLGIAERMLQLMAEMTNTIGDPGAMSGVVRLGVAETIVHTWLAQFIERVHSVYPHVTLEIEVDISPNLRNALVDGQIDLAFLLGPISVPSILNLDLSSYQLAFVGSRSLDLGTEPVPLHRMIAHPIITYPKTTRPYMMLRQILTRSDLPSPRIYSNSSLSTIVRMTMDGIGISVIPPAAIQDELKQGKLRIINTEIALPDLIFTASFAVSPNSGLIEQIARMAQEVALASASNQ